MGVLDGKSIVITGAGRGLGRAYAIAAAADGAQLVVNDVDGGCAEAVVKEIVSAGGTAQASEESVATMEGAGEIVARCVGAFGKIDALVNNAGVLRQASLLDETEEDFRRVLQVNTFGPLFCAQHAAKAMIPRHSGTILNVTSYAQSGGVDMSAYNASKAAVAALTYTWALELAQHGIRVNALSPSGATRMTDELNEGREEPTDYPGPELGAPLAVFLLSDAAWNVTGQVLRSYRNEIQIHSHPEPWAEMTTEDGWTVGEIEARFPRQLGAKLHPVGAGALSYQFGRGLRNAADGSA